MEKLLSLAAFAVLSFPTIAAAQSVFEGTWKVDLSNIDFSKKPDTYVLLNGAYECKTCVPAYSVKADGMDQPVTGHPYFNTIAITVVNDKQVTEIDKKDGKVVSTSTTTVSADGKTVKFEFTDSSNTNGGPPVTGSGEAVQVAKGPAGSHAISGSWRTSKIEGLSDNGTSVTYKVDGNSIVMTSPTGQSYTAKLDGTDAPLSGDPGTTSVSVRLLGKNTLEETDKRDGKVIGVMKLTVAADGKTAKATYEDKLQNRTTSYGLTKR